MVANLNHARPNFRKNSAGRVPVDVGVSRTAFWEAESTVPQIHPVKLISVKANTSFVLPANCRLNPEVIVFNNSGTAQAAITVGTTAGGTEYDAGASVGANSTVRRALTEGTITRTARTIYVQSAAWQAATHLVFSVTEYPPTPNAEAIS